MEQESRHTQEAPAIDARTRPGHVHYQVRDLEAQIRFYRDILGFRVHWREGDSAGLGAGAQDLLRLTANLDARPVRRTTGLYHTAFLVPSRRELAQLLRRIAITRTPIQGTSDHGTHLAIYLPDAEGNGVELAWDFPRSRWPRTVAEMLANNHGIDVDDLLSELADAPDDWAGLGPATQVGHVHLHVASLGPTRHFYADLLGFGIPMDFTDAPGRFGQTAIFFAAGDYHHHIGTNIWQGEGAPRPPANATGLLYYTLLLADADERTRLLGRLTGSGIHISDLEDDYLVQDPSGNGIRLALSPTT